MMNYGYPDTHQSDTRGGSNVHHDCVNNNPIYHYVSTHCGQYLTNNNSDIGF